VTLFVGLPAKLGTDNFLFSTNNKGWGSRLVVSSSRFIFSLHNDDDEGLGSRCMRVSSPRYVFLLFTFFSFILFYFQKSYTTTAGTRTTITVVAPCCHDNDDNDDKGRGLRQRVSSPQAVFLLFSLLKDGARDASSRVPGMYFFLFFSLY
jgi:hypothetical protein